MRYPLPVLAGFLMATVAGTPGHSQTPHTTPQTAAADDLLEMARRIDAKASGLANLWPGYWPDGQSYVLYERGVGAVFGGGAARRAADFRAGDLADARSSYDLDYPGGPPNTILLEVEGPSDDLETLFHEQFHDFQTDAFKWSGGGAGEFVDLSLISDLETYTSDLAFERHVLALALGAEEDGRRRQLARSYLTLRRTRQAGLATAVKDTEANRELVEGTAELIGLRAAALVADAPMETVRTAIIDNLSAPMLSETQAYGTSVFRERAYGVGAALSWLLDDLMAPDWRSRVAAGETLHAVLENTIGSAAEGELEGLRWDHGYAALSRQMTGLLAANPPVLSTETFLERARHHFVVVLEYPATQLASVFFGGKMTMLARSTVALSPATELSVAAVGLTLDVRDRSVLLENSRVGDQRTDRVTVLLDDINGLNALPRGRIIHPITVETAHVTLELPAGAEVEDTDTGLMIRVIHADVEQTP